MSPAHLIWFITLGCFWGLSPSLYKLMGEAGVPISQIITFTGFGVALGMGVIPLVRTGRIIVTKQVAIFTFGCAILMNIPFTLSLLFSRHVAATEYALIASTAPFWNYFVALATRPRECHRPALPRGRRRFYLERGAYHLARRFYRRYFIVGDRLLHRAGGLLRL